MVNISLFQFPEQVVSDNKKTEDWAKKCVNACEGVISTDALSVRKSFVQKRVNYNLYNGILTESDIREVVEPYGEQFKFFPKNVQHQELANSKIRILVGEEAKKLTRYPYKVFLSSADEMGVSSKEESLKEMWYQKIVEMIQSDIQDPKQIEAELQKYQKYLRYSWQDLKEIAMNKILKYEYLRLNVNEIFLRSFEDFLITGEEVVCIEELGGDVHIRKVNPLYFFTIQSPETYKVQDAEIIIEFTMMPLGEVLNRYYDVLSFKQVQALERFKNVNNQLGPFGLYQNRDINISELTGETDILAPNQVATSYFSSTFDHRGNIRVVKCVWRSKRKLKEITFPDEYGIEQVRIEDEFYKADPLLGEVEKVFLINEWWEGTKIGNDIYVKMRPIPYQDRSLVNLAQATPPYVGIVSNTNNSKARSFLDITKPTAYLYDIYHHRLNLLNAKYKGPMTAFNTSMVPTGWDPKKWFGFGEATGWLPMDPTNEILKGPSQGKSAGVFNTLTAATIDQNLGNYIAQQIQILQFLKGEMDTYSGVNDARQGDINKDQRVGTAQMAWTASNSATEKFISLHNTFKTDVMKKLLSVSKYVWKNNPKKTQYVLDDGLSEIVTWFDDIAEAEYDLHTAENANVDAMMKAITDLAHAAMQNGVIRYRDIIAIYQKDSASALARYLEEAEEETMQRQSEAAQAEQESQQALLAQQQELEYQRLQLEYEKLDREDLNKQLDRELKIQTEVISALGYSQETDVNENMIPDVVEQGKLALESQKLNQDILLKNQQMQQDKMIKDKEIKLKEKELTSKQEIEKLKIKQTEVQNKSQEKIALLNAKIKEKDIQAKKYIASKRPKSSK